MQLQEALDYINAATWSQWKLGLSRTRELLQKVGDPQRQLRFVHVAGTNGKGSTCAMIASILQAAGYRTGMYPSPFIEDFTERIQVDGVPISYEALCGITERVKESADTMEDHPSQFELITAIGMLYFVQMKCDVVVLEVGLGGMYDSTNVIDAPDAAVITNIGFDHTEYLGDTLAKITSAKAGIIKAGSDVIAYPNVPEVMEVITAACEENGCPLHVADFERLRVISADLGGQRLCWDDLELDLPLAGEYQVRNAAVALTAIEVLAARGWEITPEAVKAGMANVRWPARFEVLGRYPLFILDGGHNLQCAEAIRESLERYLPDTKLTLLIGMLADKDYAAVLDTLLPYAKYCHCVTPDSSRALPGSELAELIRGKGVGADVFEAVPEAVAACLRQDGPVLAFGSLYMAGEVRKAYRELSKGNDLSI